MINLTPIFPEIFMLGMTCIVLLVDLIFFSSQQKLIYWLSQLSLIGALGLNLYLFSFPAVLLFNQAFILDPLSGLLKILIELMGIIVFWLSFYYIKERRIPFAEFYLLGLFSILGMMLLVSANNFIVLFLGLELSALPVYAMTAMWRDSQTGSEAAMKYVVMGALASGILLYGLSLLYGATGSIALSPLPMLLPSHYLLGLFALVFITAGLAFKLGAAPFHLWVPDIYTGAPSAVTLFIGTIPKIAILGITLRLLTQTLPTLFFQWQHMLILMAIISIGLGNFAAIRQTNLKRMLAYSSIAHTGYMILGLIAGTKEGYSAALFYMISYSLMALGAFGLLVVLSQEKEIENIHDLQGLNSRNPGLAFILLLIMFSMAGIPPTVGFFAKLGVLHALINIHLVWLAVAAIIFAVIGAFYYINIVKVMYFEEPSASCLPIVFHSRPSLKSVLIGIGLSVLTIGIFPGFLFSLVQKIF